MEFQAQRRPFDRDGMQRTCDLLAVSQPEVWGVLTVENKSFGFLPARRPQTIFERHIFHKLTNGRHEAGNADVSNAAAGGYVGGAGEYGVLVHVARDEAELVWDRRPPFNVASDQDRVWTYSHTQVERQNVKSKRCDGNFFAQLSASASSGQMKYLNASGPYRAET